MFKENEKIISCRNLYIYIYVYEKKIFFVRSSKEFWQSSAPGALSTLVTSVVLYSSVNIYALKLFTEHSAEHWWEQNIFCSFPTSILAKLSTWCFENSGDISCSLLVKPSHTDESWEEWNTCLWIKTAWIYSLSTLENTDENRIFFVCSPQAFWQSPASGALSALVTSVVFYSSTRATLTSPGKDETHVCGYLSISLSIYISLSLSLSLSIYIYIYTLLHSYNLQVLAEVTALRFLVLHVFVFNS